MVYAARYINYRPKILLGLFTLCLVSFGSNAQFMEEIQNSMTKKPKIIFKFDTRKSFIGGSNVTVFGWKLGVEFDKRIRFGGGFNNLTENHSSNLDKVIMDENGIDTLHVGILSFTYFCYFVDYILIRKPKWEISYPIQIGFGSSSFQYIDEKSGPVKLNPGSVVLIETAITGHYKLTKWFGIGAGVGYRFMLQNNKDLDAKFNSPIYIFKFKLFLGGIIDSFSKKDKEKEDEKAE